MIAGFGLLGMQAYGETAYWKYHRKDRDEQFERVSCQIQLTKNIQERAERKKQELYKEELKNEELESEVKDDQFKAKDEEEAMKRKTLFQSREEYRQKRMKKIMEAKEKPESPTFEEV